MVEKHSVDIPEGFLIQIAVYGKMGDGELSDYMRNWAVQECKRLGLMQKVITTQSRKIIELRNRLTKVAGLDAMGKIDEAIDTITSKLFGGSKQ